MAENLQVANLMDLIDYQEGAVVSKSLINEKTGIVTLFAFDAGETLSEHTSPYDAMVVALDGKVEITISGDSFILGPGETIMMPADDPHALKALERFKMLLVMIKT